MEILMNIWVVFNLVFGLFTLKNYLKVLWGILKNRGYTQSDLGKLLDMVVLVSILSYILTVY